MRRTPLEVALGMAQNRPADMLATRYEHPLLATFIYFPNLPQKVLGLARIAV